MGADTVPTACRYRDCGHIRAARHHCLGIGGYSRVRWLTAISSDVIKKSLWGTQKG